MSAQHATAADTRERVRPGIYRRRNADGSTTYEIAYRDSDGRQRRQTVGPKLREAEQRLAQVKAAACRSACGSPRAATSRSRRRPRRGSPQRSTCARRRGPPTARRSTATCCPGSAGGGSKR